MTDIATQLAQNQIHALSRVLRNLIMLMLQKKLIDPDELVAVFDDKQWGDGVGRDGTNALRDFVANLERNRDGKPDQI